MSNIWTKGWGDARQLVPCAAPTGAIHDGAGSRLVSARRGVRLADNGSLAPLMFAVNTVRWQRLMIVAAGTRRALKRYLSAELRSQERTV